MADRRQFAFGITEGYLSPAFSSLERYDEILFPLRCLQNILGRTEAQIFPTPTDLTIAPVKYISYSAVVSELAKGTFVSTNMYNAEIVCELTKATQLLKAAPERKITS